MSLFSAACTCPGRAACVLADDDGRRPVASLSADVWDPPPALRKYPARAATWAALLDRKESATITTSHGSVLRRNGLFRGIARPPVEVIADVGRHRARPCLRSGRVMRPPRLVAVNDVRV